jgi:hypothetical protein
MLGIRQDLQVDGVPIVRLESADLQVAIARALAAEWFASWTNRAATIFSGAIPVCPWN